MREGYWLNSFNGIVLPKGKIFLEYGRRKPWVIYKNKADQLAEKHLLNGVNALYWVKGVLYA
jgi:hypothetical protein